MEEAKSLANMNDMGLARQVITSCMVERKKKKQNKEL